jgi:hypothetical protein
LPVDVISITTGLAISEINVDRQDTSLLAATALSRDLTHTTLAYVTRAPTFGKEATVSLDQESNRVT